MPPSHSSPPRSPFSLLSSIFPEILGIFVVILGVLLFTPILSFFSPHEDFIITTLLLVFLFNLTIWSTQ